MPKQHHTLTHLQGVSETSVTMHAHALGVLRQVRVADADDR